MNMVTNRTLDGMMIMSFDVLSEIMCLWNETRWMGCCWRMVGYMKRGKRFTAKVHCDGIFSA